MSDKLFTLPSDDIALTSDECYTPRWVFDAMALEFDLDVAAALREGRMSEHEHSREENYRLVRVICSCGWRGKWRARSAFLLERQLHSDDGAHLYAVRRGEA